MYNKKISTKKGIKTTIEALLIIILVGLLQNLVQTIPFIQSLPNETIKSIIEIIPVIVSSLMYGIYKYISNYVKNKDK